jgi:hypothetical protein
MGKGNYFTQNVDMNIASAGFIGVRIIEFR